jgi:hypothetical protein
VTANSSRSRSVDGRHEGKVVWQFEQIGNCQGESSIAINRNAVL